MPQDFEDPSPMLLDNTEISTSDDVQVIVENGKPSLDLFGVDSMLEEHKRRASDAEDGYLSSGSNMSVGRTIGLGRDKLRNHSFMARSGSGSSINQIQYDKACDSVDASDDGKSTVGGTSDTESMSSKSSNKFGEIRPRKRIKRTESQEPDEQIVETAGPPTRSRQSASRSILGEVSDSQPIIRKTTRDAKKGVASR